MSVDEVVADVESRNCQTVEVTGGEPLLQADVYPLMQRLLDAGKSVLIETGGHRSIAKVPVGVIRIVDIKCPGSLEAEKNDWSNLEHLTPRDEVKFVIADRRDYDYARDIVQREHLSSRVNAVLFSPVHGELDPKLLSEWVIADGLDVRVQLQMHKYIWSPTTRGV
jgi:7-carboxy-7-deazaguanine synthase